MYLGKIVEMADSDAIYQSPKHPYTEALLNAIPVPDPRLRRSASSWKGPCRTRRTRRRAATFRRAVPMPRICAAEEPPWLSLEKEKGSSTICGLPLRLI